MTTEKSLETRKDIDCLKFHTKTWLDHLEALESCHKNGEHASFFDKEDLLLTIFDLINIIIKVLLRFLTCIKD